MPEPEGEWSPRIAEWRLEHALMYDLRGLLVSILGQLQATASGKQPRQIKPLPAPHTLYDEVKDAARAAAQAERIDSLKYAFGYRPQ